MRYQLEVESFNQSFHALEMNREKFVATVIIGLEDPLSLVWS